MPLDNGRTRRGVGQPDSLSIKERLVAAAVGVAMGSAGVGAVFLSTNDIGSAVLLVIGSTLVLVSISGLPPRRLTLPGGGEVELAQRVQRIEGALEYAAETAPELARPFLEAIAADRRFDDKLSEVAKRFLDAESGWEVMNAVKRLLPRSVTIELGPLIQLPGQQLRLDAVVKSVGRRVGISVRRRRGLWESFREASDEAVDLRRVDSVVVVLSQEASKHRKEMEKTTPEETGILICTWNSGIDDEELKKTLSQALSA